jgi:hypothetical protein
MPAVGEWQSYNFSLQTLADAGLDVSAIDVVMIFPAWGAGEGAVYHVNNLEISADISSPELVVFTDEENPSWPMWDCCGGSTPMVQLDDDIHGNVAEFSIGGEPTVMGFISREANITDPDANPAPFDATGILENGVIEFEMKVTSMPSDSAAPWVFKVESNGATTSAEVLMNESLEGKVPVADQWQTYTFKLSDLANAGLDASAIDVLMMFPAWGAGDGALYSIDNVKIHDPLEGAQILFADEAKEMWSIWDCCGGSTPTVENDDTHGLTAEFVIGAEPTVMGIIAEPDVSIDVSSLLATGIVQFEMKVTTMPNDASAAWMFKVESIGASSAVELNLSESQEGEIPVLGEWQTYTFTLADLANAGLDVSALNVLMVFPAWGTGEGAVYRLDNVVIKAL